MNKTETNFTAAKEQAKKITKMTGAVLSSLESFDASHDELTSAIDTARNLVYWQKNYDLEAQYQDKFANAEKQITSKRPYPALTHGPNGQEIGPCEAGPSVHRNF